MTYRQCTLQHRKTTLVANLPSSTRLGQVVRLKGTDDRWWHVVAASPHVVDGKHLHDTGRFGSIA